MHSGFAGAGALMRVKSARSGGAALAARAPAPIFHAMADTETHVIYNETCPICAREVAGYRRYSETSGLPIRYHGLSSDARARLGLSADDAARRFHVVQDGRLISGLPAFVALWREMPRFRWLARLVSLPVIFPLTRLGYDRIAAPVLYAMHRRRSQRG